MGNCLLGGTSEHDEVIKVITSNGGIMEFYPPVTASFITEEYPGHGLFPSQDLFWKPLSQFYELVAGQSYYLLPLNQTEQSVGDNHIVRHGHVRSQSVPTTTNPAPYRMSLDHQHYREVGLLKRNSEPFSCRTSTSSRSISKTSSSSRFWKVKLVITPQQLLEILSQEARTKELIESVRIVAKCRVGGGGGVSSVAASSSIVSDEWSLSSSGRSTSKIDALVADI
ncbi:hypothetical protein TanjilG_15014 [Lupinus angustifolius]|uniref:Uncharacterized protein n=1 Tax=Lupinus angustifolius TaxID=3871 RepID=A0A4P1RAN8_LUPAN|nr:PREDICTED: uncharacterized protein LOC109353680 [Lupinus angustifolius]OIW06369.1 hypothetical protein TanjilG_15014 [Lupinus angustifolius]